MLFLCKEKDRPKKLLSFEHLKKIHQKQAENQKIFFKDPASELPASLKPRKSTFGTEAYVDDPAQAQIPAQHPDDAPGRFEKGEEAPGAEFNEQIAQPMISEQPLEKQVPEVVRADPASEQVKPDANSDMMKKIQEIEQQQQRFAEISDRVARGETEISILKKPVPVVKAQQQQQTGIVMQPKRKANIIAMTKGFIENLTQEGDDWLKRDGDDSKRPTLEEMKYFSYEQRINWQLQSSWKRNFERNLSPQFTEGKAVVTFSIDAQGNILEPTLLQSSGFQMLDNIILQNLKAAAPFPPLPKHFNTTIYKTARIIHVTSNRFGF